MNISVVIPVYSEEEVLKKTTTDVIGAVGPRLHEIIIVVSPKSSERTFEICKELSAAYPSVRYFTQEKNPGLGLALREAFARVTGTHVIIVDGDGEFDLRTIPLMIKKAEEGYDLVLASRWVKGAAVRDYDPLTYILNRTFQIIFRIIFWTRVHDLTYGFKLITADILKRFKWEGVWHEIAMETTLMPLKCGYRVAELPSNWEKRKEGVSKINTWKRFRYVFFALKIRFKKCI